MRNITENFNKGNIFWEYNPQFKIVTPFKELYESDNSKNKENSSNIMWAISLCYHPKSDLYYLKDKESRVFDLVKTKKFKLSEYNNIIEEFKLAVLTQAEKSLQDWEDRLKNRDLFLSKQEYHFEYEDIVTDENGEIKGRIFKSNVKDLDEMLARTAKLYQEFFKIKKDLEEETELIKKGRGGKNLSLSDSGEI